MELMHTAPQPRDPAQRRLPLACHRRCARALLDLLQHGQQLRLAGTDLAKLFQHVALEKAARRTRLSVERAVSRFANRHARLLAAEDTTLAARIDKLQAALFPAGAPQERVHSLPWYAARHGIAALKAAVQGAIQPGHPQLGAVQDLSP